jgi:hypothetical protein
LIRAARCRPDAMRTPDLLPGASRVRRQGRPPPRPRRPDPSGASRTDVRGPSSSLGQPQAAAPSSSPGPPRPAVPVTPG